MVIEGVSHPERTMTQIARLPQISAEMLQDTFMSRNLPVVITNATAQWRAMQKWSFEYFKTLDSSVDIYLEKGNVLQRNTSFEKLTFGEYMDKLIAQRDGAAEDDLGYLSIFNIFRAFPQLNEDVDFQLITKNRMRNSKMGWIGPAGTVSGYHTDWADNIFAQVQGRKFVKVVSPSQSRKMYASKKYDSNSTLSSVDADNYDREKYPLFAEVDAMYTVVNPGEMLFIPRGWWHYVRSLDPSISVNNFGVDWRGLLIDKSHERVRRTLHRVGLYGKECTCHMVVDGKRVAR